MVSGVGYGLCFTSFGTIVRHGTNIHNEKDGLQLKGSVNSILSMLARLSYHQFHDSKMHLTIIQSL